MSPIQIFDAVRVPSNSRSSVNETDGIAPDAREWYAVMVKPRHEKTVAQLLEYKGYEAFVPVYRHRHLYVRRVRDFNLPLFPGYVFSRFASNERLRILMTPGINQILGAGPCPIPIDPTEIASLRATLDKALSVTPLPFLQPGCKVRIGEGPLQGVEGIITRFQDSTRIIVSVTLLQRSVMAEVDSAWLLPGHLRMPETAEAGPR